MLCEDFIEFCDLAVGLPEGMSPQEYWIQGFFKRVSFCSPCHIELARFSAPLQGKGKGGGVGGTHSFKISSGADVVVWASCLGLFAGYPLLVWF